MSAEETKGRYGLRWQFLTVLVIAVLLLTALLIVGEVSVPGFYTRRAQDDNLALARVVAVRLTQIAGQNAAGVERLAAMPGITSMDPEQQISVLTIAEQTNPEIREMFILDMSGNIISAVPDNPAYSANRNFSNAEYYRKPLETGQPYVSNVFIDGSDVQTVIAAPIKLGVGQNAGTLNSVVSMKTGLVAEYLSKLTIGQKGYAVLVDRRGVLVWHPDAARVLRQESLRKNEVIRNVVVGQSGSMVGGLAGNSWLSSYVPVKTAGWGLIINRPINEAMPNLVMFRVVVAAIFLIGLTLVVLMYWHGFAIVIEPLRKLITGVDEVAAGDFDHRIEIKRPRELADLAESFNHMVRLVSMNFDVSRTLNSMTNLQEVEDFVLDEMNTIFHTEASAIVRFDKSGRLFVHAYRGFPAEMIHAHNAREPDLEGMIYMFGQPALNKLEKGESVLLETEKVKSLRTISPNDQVKYFYLFPLLVESKLDGVLLALSLSEAPFTEERVRTVSGLVEQVAAAVHRSDLYERLYQSYAQTTKAIARAIDAKDPYNQGHSEGVAMMAVKIARQMGLNIDAVRGIEIAAYLHDVGKIGISDDLLNKPAKLAEEELEQIRQHPVIGVAILEPIDFPWPVLAAVEHHHESYDGKGYPDNLAGEDIPLEARILAVADAYESMVSDRPYRSALDMKDIVVEFAKESGHQFDAKIVSALLDVVQVEIEQKEKSEAAVNQSQQESFEMPEEHVLPLEESKESVE